MFGKKCRKQLYTTFLVFLYLFRVLNNFRKIWYFSSDISHIHTLVGLYLGSYYDSIGRFFHTELYKDQKLFIISFFGSFGLKFKLLLNNSKLVSMSSLPDRRN